MHIFKKNSQEPVSKERMKFQEQSCWAGIVGMSQGYLVALVWVFAHGYVAEHPILHLLLGAGLLVALGKLLVEKTYTCRIAPLVGRRARQRGIVLDEVELAKDSTLTDVIFLASSIAVSVAISLTKLGLGDFTILWACATVGLVTGFLRHWCDKEKNLQARR